MRRTSSELKRLAKGSLLGRYGLPIGAFVLSIAILMGINLVLAFVFPMRTVLSTVMYFIASFISELLGMVLLTGVSVILLDMSRGGVGQFGDLFYGFRHQPDRILLSQLLIELISIVCILPGIVIMAVSILLDMILLMPVGILLFFGGLVLGIIVSLDYSLVIPLYIDCPEKGVFQLLRESKMLMHGNRGRLFYLQLSFIGISLLAALSCFIGLLWVAPYMEMTTLMFYREVIGEI